MVQGGIDGSNKPATEINRAEFIVRISASEWYLSEQSLFCRTQRFLHQGRLHRAIESKYLVRAAFREAMSPESHSGSLSLRNPKPLNP